jgi:type II secretory pathway component GspD/PulD (secretin)
MTVIPQQRALTGKSTEQPGFDVFTTGAGGTTGAQQIALPREGNATVVTNVKLDSGQTAVIGGLLRDQETHEVSKVPFLGDIPVVGWLFRGERTSNSKSNLIVFITPQIIRDSSQMRELVVNEMRDRKDRIESELLEIYSDAEMDGGDADVAPAGPSLSGPK